MGCIFADPPVQVVNTEWQTSEMVLQGRIEKELSSIKLVLQSWRKTRTGIVFGVFSFPPIE